MRRVVGTTEPISGTHGCFVIPCWRIEIILEVTDNTRDFKADWHNDVLGGNELENADDLILFNITRSLGESGKSGSGIDALEFGKREDTIRGDLKGSDRSITTRSEQENTGVLVEDGDQRGRGAVKIDVEDALAHVTRIP